MPELFPDLNTFLLCCMVMAGAQLIYATVGFGAGMISVSLMAMLLPGLQGPVSILLFLTLMTEIVVLLRHWRKAKFRLLAALLPTMALGMWVGTKFLAEGDANSLKRVLGLFVLAVGVWFLHQERSKGTAQGDDPPASEIERGLRGWLSIPAGLASGLLGGLFGTGAPPLIIYLKGYRLDKGAFRSTMLWFFLIMSMVRVSTYLQRGILTTDIALAAAWLVPASLVGTLSGMVLHGRMSDRHFGKLVSILLIVLGATLALRGGKSSAGAPPEPRRTGQRTAGSARGRRAEPNGTNLGRVPHHFRYDLRAQSRVLNPPWNGLIAAVRVGDRRHGSVQRTHPESSHGAVG